MPTSRRVGRGVVDAADSDRSFLRTSAPGRGLLVVGVDLVERLAGDLVVDALAAQLLGQRPPGQALARLAARRSRHRANASSSISPTSSNRSSSRVAIVVGDVLLGQLVGQLVAAAGLAGQLVEQDLAGHRLGVRLGPSGPRRPVAGRRRVAARRWPRRRASRPSRPRPPPPRRRARDQKSSTPIGSSDARAGLSTVGPTPSFSRIFFSSSLARSGLSLRKERAFSLPWPSWSPS